jgi:hypothetical protein
MQWMAHSVGWVEGGEVDEVGAYSVQGCVGDLGRVVDEEAWIYRCVSRFVGYK